MPTSFRYSTFISYSHTDSHWADWLQKRLEAYKLPDSMLNKVSGAPTLSPVFRDRSELASGSSLSEAIQQACQESGSMIVICSPDSARSRYVNQEILLFKKLGRTHRIFPIVVAGEPNSSDLSAECFPPALKYELDEAGSMTQTLADPLAADARSKQDGKGDALLKLVAGILDIHFDDLKKRQVRRSQLQMAIVTAVSLSVAISTIGLTVVAYQATEDAQRRQDQAEALIGFMLGDLRKRLEPVGRLDVLDAVGDEAMAYFASLPPEDRSDKATLQHAMALRQIGEVRKHQGKLDTSAEAFIESKRLLELAHQRFPDNLDVMFELSQSHFWVADIYFSRNDITSARKEIQSYRDLSEQLTEADPDNDDYWLEFSYAESNLGTLDANLGRSEKSKDRFMSVLKVQQMLLERNPDDRSIKLKIAGTYSWLGSTAISLWNIESAIEYQASGIDMRRRIRQTDDKPSQKSLASALYTHASLLLMVGRIQDALSLNNEALEIAVELSLLDRLNLGWRNREFIIRSYTARNHIALGNLDKALKLLIQNREMLSEPDPQSSYRSNSRNIFQQLSFSSVYLMLDQPDIALDHANNALARIDTQGSLSRGMKNRYAEAALLKSKSLAELNETNDAITIASEAVKFLGSGEGDDTHRVIVIHELLTFLGSRSENTITRLKGANIRYSNLGSPLMLDMDH